MVIAAQGQAGGGGLLWIMIVVLFAAMYFFMIRPQQRRRREQENMQSQMGPGDQVVTIGGLHGTIRSLDDETVTLEIAPDVAVRFARPAIGRVLASAVVDEDDEDEDDIDDDVAEDVSGEDAPGTDRTGDTGKTGDTGRTTAKAADDDLDATARKIVDPG